MRLPVILFLSSAIFWLILGAILGCLAAWKLIVPSFLDGISWLTYGRIQPAAENAWMYGWASQAGIGVGIWFLARLGRAALGSMRLLLVAGLFWNLAVLLGICSILAGYGNSFRGLEFSGGTALVLLMAYICIGVWSLSLLHARLGGGLYVTQWYLLAAFLCFPWLYGTANLLLVWSPVAGSAQGPIAAWDREVSSGSGSLRWPWQPFITSSLTLRVVLCTPTPQAFSRFGAWLFSAGGPGRDSCWEGPFRLGWPVRELPQASSC